MAQRLVMTDEQRTRVVDQIYRASSMMTNAVTPADVRSAVRQLRQASDEALYELDKRCPLMERR